MSCVAPKVVNCVLRGVFSVLCVVCCASCVCVFYVLCWVVYVVCCVLCVGCFVWCVVYCFSVVLSGLLCCVLSVLYEKLCVEWCAPCVVRPLLGVVCLHAVCNVYHVLCIVICVWLGRVACGVLYMICGVMCGVHHNLYVVVYVGCRLS